MTARRDRWAEFICDPTRPARYLAGLGDTVGIHVQPILDETFVQFVGKLTSKGADARTLIDTLDYVFGGYQEFLRTQLKGLLRELAHESFREQEVQGPGIKGKVNWPATLVARSSGRLPDGRFLVRRPSKSFDLPENQLLKLLLSTAATDLGRMAGVLGSGGLLSTFADMRRIAEAGLRDFNLRTVTRMARMNPEMVARADAHRNPAYREIADLMGRRERVVDSVTSGRLEALLSMVRSGWLAPVNDDDLFELYALALTLDVLSDECGFGAPSEYGLVLRGRSHVALFPMSGMKATLYFDQTPAATYGLKTRYSQVLSCWEGVSGGERRPDIMVEFERNGAKHVLLVEIKRTDDDRYRRDSIYKVFGYLYDFHALWKSANLPRAALLFPDKIESREPPGGDVLIRLVSGESREHLAGVFGEILSAL